VIASGTAAGVDGGAEYARESLSEPREGTILSVLTAFAHAVQRARKDGMHDFRSILRQGVAASQAALAQTTYQLEALRKANVVDAGAPPEARRRWSPARQRN